MLDLITKKFFEISLIKKVILIIIINIFLLLVTFLTFYVSMNHQMSDYVVLILFFIISIFLLPVFIYERGKKFGKKLKINDIFIFILSSSLSIYWFFALLTATKCINCYFDGKVPEIIFWIDYLL
ncbi:MAG: hypothetical protein JXA68_09485 [Ignavibacteriales bacterium]|nr:hypothetical protein [Ignavibacteriales bacterium]